MTHFVTTINNDDTEYSTLLNNRELMQIWFSFKHNNNKTIHILQSHEITNYTQNNLKCDTTNAKFSLNDSWWWNWLLSKDKRETQERIVIFCKFTR